MASTRSTQETFCLLPSFLLPIPSRDVKSSSESYNNDKFMNWFHCFRIPELYPRLVPSIDTNSCCCLSLTSRTTDQQQVNFITKSYYWKSMLLLCMRNIIIDWKVVSWILFHVLLTNLLPWRSPLPPFLPQFIKHLLQGIVGIHHEAILKVHT